MICTLCKKEAKITKQTKNSTHYEWFFSLSWKDVNIKEYKNRKKDGRATSIQQVCFDCIIKYTRRPPLGLSDLNEIRKRKISNEQYYEEHGY